MRFVWVVAAALAFAAGCASDDRQMRTGPEVSEASTGVREGKVGALYEDRMILLDPNDQGAAGMVVRYDDRTDVVRRGEKVGADSIEEGTPVRVFYSQQGETNQAIRVEILEGDEAERIDEELEELGE